MSGAAKTTSQVTPIGGKRKYWAATVLGDGRILISGGVAGTNHFLNSAFLLDPATGRFAATGNMVLARHSQTTVLLDDGRVLVAGGWARSPDAPDQPVASVPGIWNPDTGTWHLLAGIDLDWHDRLHVGKLADGSVLFLASRELAGKNDPQGPITYRAWRWNPDSRKIRTIPVPATPRASAGVAILPDGRVVIAGGLTAHLEPALTCEPESSVYEQDGFDQRPEDNNDENCPAQLAHWVRKPSALIEVWDSRDGGLQHLPDMTLMHGGVTQAIVLRDAKVLLTRYRPPNPWWEPKSSPVLIDLATGKRRRLPSLSASETKSIVQLGDGTLLSLHMSLAPSGKAWVHTPPEQTTGTFVALRYGNTAISVSLSSPYVTMFNVATGAWTIRNYPHQPPRWKGTPTMVEMTNHKVMFAGLVGWVDQANIWDPATDTWMAAGNLARGYRSDSQMIALPDGGVLHLGVFDLQTDICESWNPGDGVWRFCGTLHHGTMKGPPGLGLLSNGRVAVIYGRHAALMFDERKNAWAKVNIKWGFTSWKVGAPVDMQQPLARIQDPTTQQWLDATVPAARMVEQYSDPSANVLWDPSRHVWAYVFLPVHTNRPIPHMVSDAVLLPDGCAWSWATQSMFNPRTGLVHKLPAPATGLDPWSSNVILLSDGSLVMAGAGAPASHGKRVFFHTRPLSCDGFGQSRHAASTTPGTTPGLRYPKKTAPATNRHDTSTFLQDLTAWILRYRWIIFAISGPLILYFVLSRWVLPRLRVLTGARNDRPAGSTGFRWTIRAIVYGVALFVVVIAVVGYLDFRHATARDACAEDPRGCMKPHSTVLASIAKFVQIGGGGPNNRIPCKYVGIWSSFHRRDRYRIELKADGTYSESLNIYGIASKPQYTGYWVVQGSNFVWRSTHGSWKGADINPILDSKPGAFTLREMNGTITRFKKIGPLPPGKCAI